ncbi:hypothetical protein OPKNFCMD_5762 [Methylobacterium crusticola]|uniref:Uncharacterized protein n=1 Tax=Methylobacterium crusticola TaxID=1697972 RepID=A0ABQ4R5L8_9HYPH|nr:hypothetical protein OPKNFCMD_5762 [Methylobacterium crusticola]
MRSSTAVPPWNEMVREAITAVGADRPTAFGTVPSATVLPPPWPAWPLTRATSRVPKFWTVPRVNALASRWPATWISTGEVVKAAPGVRLSRLRRVVPVALPLIDRLSARPLPDATSRLTWPLRPT